SSKFDAWLTKHSPNVCALRSRQIVGNGVVRIFGRHCSTSLASVRLLYKLSPTLRYLQRSPERPGMAERILEPPITHIPEHVLRRHGDGGAGGTGPLQRGV